MEKERGKLMWGCVGLEGSFPFFYFSVELIGSFMGNGVVRLKRVQKFGHGEGN